MNIDDLTIGQARELATLFAAKTAATQDFCAPVHPFVGKYCIARCYSAGVHAGEVVWADGENAILRESRRLWKWEAKNGIALSGLAQHGQAGGKVDVVNPEIYLTGVCELIPCTPSAKESIHGFK